MTDATLTELLTEYDRARAWTDDLWTDLDDLEVHWRSDEESSAIAWHLGHQPTVAHFLLRNLTSAEPSPDREFDEVMDSATAESQRGDLPATDRIAGVRAVVADRVHHTITRIDEGRVGAPSQLRVIAHTLLVAIVNHEYQHSTWISEVRRDAHGRDLPPTPTSDHLTTIDGYPILA